MAHLHPQEQHVAKAHAGGLQKRQHRHHAVAPEVELARLGVVELGEPSLGDRRLDRHHHEQRADPQRERRVERRHLRTEVVGREHSMAIERHRCRHGRGKHCGVRADDLAQLLDVATCESRAQVAAQRRELARRRGELVLRIGELRLRTGELGRDGIRIAAYLAARSIELRGAALKRGNHARHRCRKLVQTRLDVVVEFRFRIVEAGRSLVRELLDLGTLRDGVIVARLDIVSRLIQRVRKLLEERHRLLQLGDHALD